MPIFKVVCKCTQCERFSPKAKDYCLSCLSNFCDEYDEATGGHK